MAVKITYFVHGTTTDNETDLATGWRPGELSKLGKAQAKELGKTVSDKKFDVIICSDLKRAIDSANLAFLGKCRIIQDRRLRECNFGNLTGDSVKLFKDEMEKYIDKRFPNGESYKEVEKRIKSFLEFLKQNYDGKCIAIVAHQAPQLALDVLIKGKTWKQAIDEDWRKEKKWQPGWKYVFEV